MSKHLILGGARSGKSRYAEELALASASEHQQHLYYIATAARYGDDAEMQQRIALHQQRRIEQLENMTRSSDSSVNPWQLIEEPIALADVIRQYDSPEHCLLIDCLTLWLTNALLGECWDAQKADFLQALQQSQATIFLVSNEVGSGIVPLGELSRQFVDESGTLHQTLSPLCEQVSLVVAGLPLVLKSNDA